MISGQGKRILHLFKSGSGDYNKEYIDVLGRSNYLKKTYQHQLVFIEKGTFHSKETDLQCVFLDDYHFIGKKLRILAEAIESNDTVILHGLFHPYYILTLALNTSSCSKAKWVVWGGDLYSDTSNSSNKFKIITFMRSPFIQRITRNLDAIVTLVPYDYEIAKRMYGTKAKHFNAFYPNPIKLNYLDSIRDEGEETKTPTILLGNSATRTNGHFEVIDMLAQKKQNISFNVVCPLSYGDMQYGAQVIQYGKQRLGESFLPLTVRITPPEYARVLGGIDVAVMNHRRQQAVGTIFPLLYAGAKVYLRKDTSTYRWLTDLGAKIFDLDEFIFTPCHKIFEFPKRYSQENRKIIAGHYSESHFVETWKRVFDS